MRLQDHPSLVTPELHLEYKDENVTIAEASITKAINAVTDEISGSSKGICSTPVTIDVVNIGLGYICVRKQVGDESYEEARAEEARLFEVHPLLSKIDK